MTHDRDFVYIKDRAVRHTTAARDWVCGTCGGKLLMRFYTDAPNWRTVCAQDEGHDPDAFVHAGAWAYLQARQALDDDRAQEIFNHLPRELRDAILAST